MKAKAGTVIFLGFGEKVLWKKKADKEAKLRSRRAYGIFVGVRKRSGEWCVVTKTGELKKVRAVKRIPEEERWCGDSVNWVKYVMWNKFKEDPQADGALLEGNFDDVQDSADY